LLCTGQRTPSTPSINPIFDSQYVRTSSRTDSSPSPDTKLQANASPPVRTAVAVSEQQSPSPAKCIFSLFYEMDLKSFAVLPKRQCVYSTHHWVGKHFYPRCVACDTVEWSEMVDPFTLPLTDKKVANLGRCGCICCRGCVFRECMDNAGWRACPKCQYDKSHQMARPIWPVTRSCLHGSQITSNN
jgi:hypothetical protein